MKKLISLVTAGMLAMSLAACGFKRFRQRSCWRQFCFVRADHRYGLLHVFQ